MVRRVFGFYLLRLLNGELRDLRSLSSYYYRFLVSSLFRRYKDKFSYSVKDEKNKTPKLHLLGFGLSHFRMRAVVFSCDERWIFRSSGTRLGCRPCPRLYPNKPRRRST